LFIKLIKKSKSLQFNQRIIPFENIWQIWWLDIMFYCTFFWQEVNHFFTMGKLFFAMILARVSPHLNNTWNKYVSKELMVTDIEVLKCYDPQVWCEKSGAHPCLHASQGMVPFQPFLLSSPQFPHRFICNAMHVEMN